MTVFVIGGYRLDDVRHELTGPEGPVPVEPQVFDVLRHLLASGGRLVSKEELLATVWGHTFVAESALTTRIKQARRALGDEGATQWAIGTVRGRGYRLVAGVTVDEHPLVRLLGAGAVEVLDRGGAGCPCTHRLCAAS